MGSKASVMTQPMMDEEAAYATRCGSCKQVADTTYHRLFALGIGILAIVVMVLVWFTGILFQIVIFIMAFLIFALGVLIAILPIECKRCKCE